MYMSNEMPIHAKPSFRPQDAFVRRAFCKFNMNIVYATSTTKKRKEKRKKT